MTNNTLQPRAQWDSNFDYLIVTIGSVIGLGNIFQFPFYIAKYGSIFIVFFLLFEIFISIPIILAEFFIGRRGKQNPIGAFSVLAMESGANYRWRWIGLICFIILTLTLGYYTFNVSTILSSLIQTLGHFSNVDVQRSVIPYSKDFTLHISYFLIFLIMTMLVVARGINRGLEKISRVIVPFFFILFFILALYSSLIGKFNDALLNLLKFKGEVTAELLLAALTYAFFKLNTAMGCMIVYGSYLPATTRLGKSTCIIVIFDFIASLLSYFIVFPILFLQPQITPLLHKLDTGIIVNTFIHMPGGIWIAAFFLLGTILASWMPAIAFAESATVTLIERASFKRIFASILIGMSALIIGSIIFLTGRWIHNQWLISNMLEELAGQILTPISAFLIAIFSGWIIKKEVAFSELNLNKVLFALWRFLIRYIVPIFIMMLFVYLLWV